MHYLHSADGNFRLVIFGIGIPQKILEQEYTSDEKAASKTYYMTCKCEGQASVRALEVANGRAFLLYRHIPKLFY